MTKHLITRDDAATPGSQFTPPTRAEILALVGQSDTGYLRPEMFGPHVGQGGDDTDALLAAIEATISEGKRLYLPGTYRIETALPITGSDGGFFVDGHGKIIQQTNGESIFEFIGENVSHFGFADFWMEWANQQTPEMGTAAVTFTTGGTGAYLGWYNFVFDNLRIEKGYRGYVSLEDGNNNCVFQGTFRKLWHAWKCTGQQIRLRGSQAGQTCVVIDNCYMQREHSLEGCMDLALMDMVDIRAYEVNGENNDADGAIKIAYSNAVLLTGRVERGTLNGTGKALIHLDNCGGVKIPAFSVQAIQGFSGTKQSLIKATATKNIAVSASLSTYSPQPNFPSTFYVISADSSSTITAADAVLQGSAQLSDVTIGAPVADNSVGPAKLVNGGTTPGAGKYYEGNGRWSTPAGGGGSATRKKRRSIIAGPGNSATAIAPSYDPVRKVNTHLGVAGGHSGVDYINAANVSLGCPFDDLGSVSTVGYSMQQIIDNHLQVVRDAKPDIAFPYFEIGNDMRAGGAFTKAVLNQEIGVYDTLLQDGIEVIVGTSLPMFNSSNSGVTMAEIERYNARIWRWAELNDCEVVDFYNYLVDPMTGSFKTTGGPWTDDGTHPNFRGAALGQVPAMKAVMQRLMPNAIPHTNLVGYQSGTGLIIPGQAANPLLARTGGAANTPDGCASSNMTVALAASPYAGQRWTLTSTAELGTATLPVLAGSEDEEWDLTFRWGAVTSGAQGYGFFLMDQGGNAAGAWGYTNTPNLNQITPGTVFHAHGKFLAGDTSLQILPFLKGSGAQMTLEQVSFRNLSDMEIL